jgi:opacity protein-like surface antigen
MNSTRCNLTLLLFFFSAVFSAQASSKFVENKSTPLKTHIEDIKHLETAINDQFSIDTPPDNPNIKWKIEKTSTRIWVDPDEETVDINYLGMPWLELHYTQEGWNVLDTISQITHGFNLQLMSHNLIHKKDWAFYAGLDWGKQYSGRSDKKQVAFDLTESVLGKTWMYKKSTDLLFRGHIELNKMKIAPYLTFFGGPRVYSIGQKIVHNRNPRDSDGFPVLAGSKENLTRHTLIIGGAGIGVRIPLKEGGSLDIRYEQIYGGRTALVDMEGTGLIGTVYTPSYVNQRTNTGQLKLGWIIGENSSSVTDRYLQQEGHWIEYSESSKYFNNNVLANDIYNRCSNLNELEWIDESSKEIDWSEEKKGYLYHPFLNRMGNGWFGIHYTEEGWGSLNFGELTSHGYNFQLMTKNKVQASNWALYTGADFGMQFNEKSNRQEILFDNDREDIGFTYLSSKSLDLLVRGHLEYAKYKIIPYVTMFSGPRFQFVDQTTSIYNPVTPEGNEVEQVATDDLSTKTRLIGGVGFGTRIRITRRMSMDVRYEYLQHLFASGDNVDLKATKFVDTNYELVYTNAKLKAGNLKIGLIFNVGHKKQYKTYEQKYATVTSVVYLNPKDNEQLDTIINKCLLDEKMQIEKDKARSREMQKLREIEAFRESRSNNTSSENPTTTAKDDNSTPILKNIFDKRDKSSTPKQKKEKMPDIKDPVIRH